MTKDEAIIREVGCPKITCRAKPGQPCRREFRRTPTSPLGATILKHPHKERRDYYNGAHKPQEA